MSGPGLIALLGSGETAAAGGQVFDMLAARARLPFHAAVLETPAGFELNSAQVAGRVADFISRRLQNYHAEVTVIPARRKGTPYSPDEPTVVDPLYRAGMIFLGPGSPTYAVRQLTGSLAWEIVRAAHRAGSALVIASAAVVAAGRYALPVYEIYKAGMDPFWAPGLDLFAQFGLSLVLVPHWNNSDGGAELDTSHCFIGQSRFEQLRTELPPDLPIIGIDEHTALILDLQRGEARVLGRGSIHILTHDLETQHSKGGVFSISSLGNFSIPPSGEGIAPDVYQRVLEGNSPSARNQPEPTFAVRDLIQQRESARLAQEWAEADRLRQELLRLGWAVKDTPQGPLIESID